MKSFLEIYSSIKNRFKSNTNIEITDGTAIDSFVLASAEALAEAHEEIEKNKNPHIYTNIKEKDIDKMGLLINCPRHPNESDESYLYRCMKWTLINESCNATAIESALSNLEHSSHATYVPYTEGTGSATVFIIPNTYEKTMTELSLKEVKARLEKVISPDSYIKYQICRPLLIDVYVYTSFQKDYDEKAIENNINIRIKEYINSIPIGETLSYGSLNRIGLEEKGVEFFNATHIYISEMNDKGEIGEPLLLSSLNAMQTIETKFLFRKIEWRKVVS